MKVSSQAMSLGVVEKAGGVTKDGEQYEGYTVLNYVVVGEDASRKFYVPKDDKELMRRIFMLASDWGNQFAFEGEVDARGKLVLFNVTES